jgi:hypothetical protein
MLSASSATRFFYFASFYYGAGHRPPLATLKRV